jgi:hypothetical protein
MLRSFFNLIVVASFIPLAGCSDTSKTQTGNSKKDHLADVGEMLKSLAEERKKPPSKLAELESVEPMMPLGGPAIRGGEVVYLWGAEYASGSNKIAAYEKKVPTEGGWVLLQDGSVKEMTADEFRAAPKAK